jgi:hypothetical protein
VSPIRRTPATGGDTIAHTSLPRPARRRLLAHIAPRRRNRETDDHHERLSRRREQPGTSDWRSASGQIARSDDAVAGLDRNASGLEFLDPLRSKPLFGGHDALSTPHWVGRLCRASVKTSSLRRSRSRHRTQRVPSSKSLSATSPPSRHWPTELSHRGRSGRTAARRTDRVARRGKTGCRSSRSDGASMFLWLRSVDPDPQS